MKFTGDADLDFMSHMRSHDQVAVDMAKVVLANGTDAAVKNWRKTSSRRRKKKL